MNRSFIGLIAETPTIALISCYSFLQRFESEFAEIRENFDWPTVPWALTFLFSEEADKRQVISAIISNEMGKEDKGHEGVVVMVSE